MKKVNIGIIGCGHWGPNYIRDFNNLRDCRLKIICDLSPSHLERMKIRFPSILTTTNYKNIIYDDKIDAVVIATPAATHYTLLKEAIRSKKHILVEKPFVTSILDAQEIVVLSEKTEKVLMVAHTFLYNSAVRSLKKYLKNKALGKIYYLHSKRTNLGPLRNDVSATWDLAPHDISIFSYLLDANPKSVVAQSGDYLQKNKEDVSFITLMYPNNVIAHIHVSWLDPRKVREITVVGSKKMALFNDLEPKEPIRIYDKRVMKKWYKHDYSSFREFKMIIKERGVIVPKIRVKEPLSVQCEHFIDCIRTGRKPLTPAANGLEIVKVLCAIDDSIRKKGKIINI